MYTLKTEHNIYHGKCEKERKRKSEEKRKEEYKREKKRWMNKKERKKEKEIHNFNRRDKIETDQSDRQTDRQKEKKRKKEKKIVYTLKYRIDRAFPERKSWKFFYDRTRKEGEKKKKKTLRDDEYTHAIKKKIWEEEQKFWIWKVKMKKIKKRRRITGKDKKTEEQKITVT